MKTLPLFCALIAIVATSQPVLAQVRERVTEAPDSGRWIGFVIALVLGTCIVTASVWGSKRTHQD